jgi:2-polyprenyl-6-methoxyphenol hydroxylase-like FAD-dependent oxidoreductase
MATTLGKGANCALLDAIALAETLTLTPLYKNSSPASSIYSQPRSSYEVTRTRRTQLYKFAQDNVSRRLEERSRSAILQNLFYFGEGKLKAYVRDKGLDFMLKWVERPS